MQTYDSKNACKEEKVAMGTRGDLISRSALIIEIVCGNLRPEICDGAQEVEWMEKCIDTAPAVEAEPVVHAEWYGECEKDKGGYCQECSNCHKVRPLDNYCSNCGAKMDGGGLTND